MDLLDKAKFLLRQYNIRPRRKLGQSFCVNVGLLKRMIEHSNLDGDDIVLEVGAGFGFLTELLSRTAKEVIAIEVDSRIVRALRDQLTDRGNVTIIEGDALRMPLPWFNKIVTNPPYSISSPLLLNILEKKFECAVLTLQREFVKRLVAQVSSRDYGSLAVIAYFRANIQCLEMVPRNSFYPQPEVTSNIVIIRPKDPPFYVANDSLFFSLVKMLFTQRNKKLRNVLEVFISEKIGVKKKEARTLIEDFPYLDLKTYELRPEEFGTLSNRVYRLLKSKRVSFENNLFYVFPEVYEPSDDTFLLAELARLENCRRVLDVGTGCGILGILMAKRAEVVAVDINPYAVECTKLNAKLNARSDEVKVQLGDLFEGVNEKFDLILFNPPYLPCTESYGNDLLEKAWSGGPSGRETIDRFLNDVPNFLEKKGKTLLVQSTLSNPEETIKILEKLRFQTRILAEKKFDFEKLVIIQAIYEGE